MLFLAAVDLLSHDELVQHAANLNTFSWGRVTRDKASGAARTGKRFLLGGGGKAASLLSKAAAKAGTGEGLLPQLATATSKGLGAVGTVLRGVNDQLEWDPDRLAADLGAQRQKLDSYPDSELRKIILQRVAALAGVWGQDAEDPESVGRAALLEAAKGLKLETRLVAEDQVEKLVFEAYCRRLLDRFRRSLQAMTEEEETKLEQSLREEIERLSEGDAERLAQAMGIEELSAKSMVRMLARGGGAATALIAAEASGMGIFLFTTTMLKAFSLLLGTTFAFSTYMAAASTVAFLTSLPGALLVVGGMMGLTGAWDRKRFNRELLASEIASLHGKLLGRS